MKESFRLGENVYLVHDPEQVKWMITYITKSISGIVVYGLTAGLNNYEAFPEELTREKQLMYD